MGDIVRRKPLRVMVSVNGIIDDENTVRTSFHAFEFSDEQELNEWLALAPNKKPELFEGMPDIHVEIPGTNRA